MPIWYFCLLLSVDIWYIAQGTSISMKAKPGGFLATQTFETLPILPKASSMSNLRKWNQFLKVLFHQRSSLSSKFCFQPFGIKTKTCTLLRLRRSISWGRTERCAIGRLLQEERWSTNWTTGWMVGNDKWSRHSQHGRSDHCQVNGADDIGWQPSRKDRLER